MLAIRVATTADFPAIWRIFAPIIAAGETYEFDETLTREAAYALWFGASTTAFVADLADTLVGAYKLRPNHAGRGSHIANGSYIVAPQWQGQGVGRALVEHSLQTATQQGYRAIQFNIVVSTNRAAIQLYEKLGFQILGTIPEGFRHQRFGYVDTYVMYRSLVEPTRSR